MVVYETHFLVNREPMSMDVYLPLAKHDTSSGRVIARRAVLAAHENARNIVPLVKLDSPRCKRCNACNIERIGCACDGALDNGCFLCTPDEHRRPPCPAP